MDRNIKKIIFTTAISLFLATSFFSCKEKKLLTNTTWKLVGFVNTETSEIKEADRKENNWYILTFNMWGKFTGNSSMNSIEGKYNIDCNTNKIKIFVLSGTAAGETSGGKLYMDVLSKVDFFSVQDNELKLYYSNKQNYLLYKSEKL